MDEGFVTINEPAGLWRRTKEGLHMSEAQRADLAEWMATRRRNSL